MCYIWEGQEDFLSAKPQQTLLNQREISHQNGGEVSYCRAGKVSEELSQVTHKNVNLKRQQEQPCITSASLGL